MGEEENGHNDASPTELEQKIIRQVEYYFSNINMMKDKFLKEEVKKDDGWVLLKTLLTFNRLKALSEDATVIVAAIRKSKSELLEIRDEELAVRREPAKKVPSLLDDDTRTDLNKRTVYAKGYPLDATMDDLLEFSESEQERILMRYDKEKKFKGSLFITFKTEDLAKKFIEAEEVKYKDDSLIIERQFRTEYLSKKSKKGVNKEEEVKAKEEMKKQKEKEEREEALKKMTAGAVLKVAGFKGFIKVEEIKAFFGQFSDVAWVDYNDGDEFAYVRFTTENLAEEAWQKAVKAAEDGEVTYGEDKVVLTASALKGEDEEEHWIKMFESISRKAREQRENRFRGGRGGGNRGRGRGGRGGRKRPHGGDGDKSSKIKKESE